MRTKNLWLVGLAIALSTVCQRGQAAVVDLSLNVFPTSPGNPNAGGSWTLVAKTDAPFGIAGFVVYLQNVAISSISFENDIAADFDPPFFVPISDKGGGVTEVVYAQGLDHFPLFGVGTLSFSDGPDPLGESAWDGATRILSGTYAPNSPSFTNLLEIDSNIFNSMVVGPGFIQQAAVQLAVRVAAVPEASSVAALTIICLGFVAKKKVARTVSPRTINCAPSQGPFARPR